jgi:transcriptional regulator with XRE-family HTH domain
MRRSGVNDMSFGQRLKQARKEAKLTQEQVAKRLGLDYSTISKYENNHSEPDNETLAKMAEIYNVKVDYLITGRSDAPSPSDKKDKPVNRAFLELPEDTTEEEREFLQAQLDAQLEIFRKLKKRSEK